MSYMYVELAYYETYMFCKYSVVWILCLQWICVSEITLSSHLESKTVQSNYRYLQCQLLGL